DVLAGRGVETEDKLQAVGTHAQRLRAIDHDLTRKAARVAASAADHMVSRWHPRSVSRARAVRIHLCPTYRSSLRISMTPFGGSRRWGSSSSMVRQLRNVRRFYVRDPFGRLVNILSHDRC